MMELDAPQEVPLAAPESQPAALDARKRSAFRSLISSLSSKRSGTKKVAAGGPELMDGAGPAAAPDDAVPA